MIYHNKAVYKPTDHIVVTFFTADKNPLKYFERWDVYGLNEQ